MEKDTFLVHQEVQNYLKTLIKSTGINELIDLTIQPGSSKGDNYLGIIAKVSVDGRKNGENIKLHWIVKSASQNKSFRELSCVQQVFEREIYIYKELFPIFLKFQIDKCVENPFKSFPSLIGSHFKPYEEAVIMEDMKCRDFVLKNRKETLDFDHVRLIMIAYAKFHAVSYAIKDQNPELFETIRQNTEEYFFLQLNQEMLMKQDESFCIKSFNVLDPVKHSLHRSVFSKYKNRSFRIILDTFKKSYRSPYSVVGHGDSWVNNMLFKYEGKRPVEVCLLDFQLARYGSPAFDLSYFIFACTNKSLRDKHYDELINIYYQTLCGHLVNLGSSAEKLLPFTALKEELKRYSIVGFFLSQLVLHLMVSDQDEIPDLNKEMTGEEFMNAFAYESKNEEIYQGRIRDTLVDFVEKGYFDFLDEYSDEDN